MNQETVEYLKNFKTLLDEGLITQDEYEKKKKELLEEPIEVVAPPTGAPINISSTSASSEQSKQNTVGQQQASSNTTSKTNPIDIIWIVVGSIFVFIGLFGFLINGPKGTFGTDYMSYQYATAAYMVQAVYIAVAAIGSIEICMGLKGILGKNDSSAQKDSSK